MQHPLCRGSNGHERRRAMVKQAFGSSMATEISSSLSDIAQDTILILFGLRLVLYQVMGLKQSDKVTTPLSRTNTRHILWLQPLLLHRTTHKPELVSVLQDHCTWSRGSRSRREATVWCCKEVELSRCGAVQVGPVNLSLRVWKTRSLDQNPLDPA